MSDKAFTKDNLDLYLKEVAKAFRKRNGRSVSAEIVIVFDYADIYVKTTPYKVTVKGITRWNTSAASWNTWYATTALLPS